MNKCNSIFALFSVIWSCGPGRVFVYCHYELQLNCTNYERMVNMDRNFVYDTYGANKCISGCVCVEPKIKGPDGECILPEECPNATSGELLTNYGVINSLIHFNRK